MDGRERVLDQGSKGITSLGSLVWSLEEDDQISVWDCLAEADNGVGRLAGRKARGDSQRRPLGRRYVPTVCGSLSLAGGAAVYAGH